MSKGDCIIMGDFFISVIFIQIIECSDNYIRHDGIIYSSMYACYMNAVP